MQHIEWPPFLLSTYKRRPPLSFTRHQESKKRSRASFLLSLARIREGVREERVREVLGLSATSPSVLATLS